MKLGNTVITKAYKQVSRHYNNQATISLHFEGILPRCRVSRQLNEGFAVGNYRYIRPLFGYNGEDKIPISEFKRFIQSLPLVVYQHDYPYPLTDSEFELIKERAAAVDSSIDIMYIKSPGYDYDIRCNLCKKDKPHTIEQHII